MKQLRMSKRVKVNYAAVFKSDSSSVDGVIEQMSEGGLSFCSAAVLDTDSVGLFVFSAIDGEQSVSVRGELIYMLPGKQGREPGYSTSQYGVRFVETTGEQYENIIRIVRFATVRQRYTASKKRPLISIVNDD
jgi:hypothetical protein